MSVEDYSKRELEIELLKHDLSLMNISQADSDSDANKAWVWKRKFIIAKQTAHNVGANDSACEDDKNKNMGFIWVLNILQNLSDEEWLSIDRIDEVLTPVYEYYRKNQNDKFGIETVLWGYSGIFNRLGRESVLNGGGCFPIEREQLALDYENGWDGICDRFEWRESIKNMDLDL